MGTCQQCHNSAQTISDVIGFCKNCIRTDFDKIWPKIKAIHNASRKAYDLPEDPPQHPSGITCPLCLHGCTMEQGQVGFCGLRRVEKEIIKGGRPHEGNLTYYFDPLPTNCVSGFVCPGGTGCGFPKYSVTQDAEYGHHNMAVFYHACSFNCLYCQNYNFKERTFSKRRISAKNLAESVTDDTTCICYFGGDPTPQILHALKTSTIARNKAKGRILRICWETNGAVKEPFLSMMAEHSLESGGCIKYDLKAWDTGIHHALCGVTNQNTLDNFKRLSRLISLRPSPPLLIASTLLVPGYIDELEVVSIASYLAKLDPDIPYSLLAFFPNFFLHDLPTTSRSHALQCKRIAENTGLNRVYIGNVHLLRPG